MVNPCQPDLLGVELRGEWRAMCCRAGLGHYLCKRCGHKATEIARCAFCKISHRQWKYVGKLVHDLRRSAAKQMRLAGVPDSSIKDTGGWKTTAVMHRYQIGDKRDRMQVVQRILAAREATSGQPVVIPSQEQLASMPTKSLKPA